MRLERARTTTRGYLSTVLLCAVLCLSASAQTAPQGAAVSQYTGPGSCASSSCHGAIQPRTETDVQQNEYSTWVVQDKHAKAYTVLSNPQSKRIARNLKLSDPPEKAAKCLACHALDVPASRRARTFELDDGVSCENCHGPASAWLGPHTSKNWTHEQSVRLGMYDTKDLVKRSELCLSCHLGTADKSVDHEMLAAGHPDLTFELDSFSAVMPRHWKEHPEKDPWANVRAWSVGQAVQLREALRQLERRSRGPNWPEYAELDCFSCHHALTKPADSWRQEMGYSGRKPGTPPWNNSRIAVLRHIVRDADPQLAQQLDGEMAKVAASMNRLAPAREAVAQTASSAGEVAGRALDRLASRKYDQASALRMLGEISADADAISEGGERSAEQAVMASDVLALACAKNGKLPNEAEVKAAIDAMFQQLENPSSYNPQRFREQLARIKSRLP